MNFWRGTLLIAAKDLAMEAHGKEIITTNLMFSVLTVVVFNFAFDMGSIDVKQAAAGILWVAFLFAASLSMNRSFLYEKEEGCLSALMLAPLDRGSIYFGKMLANLLLTMIGMAFIVPIFIALYNVNVMENFFWQTLTLFLGAVGIICVGTLISAVSVNVRAREMLGPLLMLPVVAPVLISAVKASGGLIRGEDVESLYVWFKLLGAFDVIYLIISWLVFDHILEE